MVFVRTVRYVTTDKTGFVPKSDIGTPTFPILPEPSPQLQDEFVILIMRVSPRDFRNVAAERVTEAELERVRALGYPMHWYTEPPGGGGAYHDVHGSPGGCLVLPGESWKIFE